ncbi:MAG TPA: alpha/beta hydrolase [Phycisphaerae bacterium]|nr:alpha/beta hydrolase [Phycisphaerae bacterium]
MLQVPRLSKCSAAQILAVFLFAALASDGGTSANATAPEEVRTVTVDDHRVAFRVVGSGRPAIVLISGLGDGMATFQDIARDLGKTNTVIVYDRAGYGGSDPGDGLRDASAAERELSGLLAQSGVVGPYVLSGHSLGGLLAEYYAANHPDQVSGLILEDSRPADFTRRCTTALGASRCLPPAWLVWLMPKGARDEVVALEQVVAQVEGSVPLRGKPVLVLSRPRGDARKASFDALWTQAQGDLAARYPGSRHLAAVAGGHYIHRDQRDWFLFSVRAFLTAVR